MKKGILGRKLGMTQVFTKDGKMIPVTVVSVEPNIVTQVKTDKTDGYNAIQLGFENKRDKLANKPEIGHTKKATTAPKRFFREIRDVDVKEYKLGQSITVELFKEGEMVDVTGTSKGKGFQGSIKRHNYSRGPMSHGSHHHRGPGSLGTMLPKRVQRGTKLPGHMGVDTVTVQNLEIVMVDLENNVLLVKGNVPGPKKSLVIIRTAIKNPDKINQVADLNFYDENTKEVIEEMIENQTEVVEEEQIDTTEVSEEITEEETAEEVIEVIEEEELAEEVKTEETVVEETKAVEEDETKEEAVSEEQVVEEATEEEQEEKNE